MKWPMMSPRGLPLTFKPLPTAVWFSILRVWGLEGLGNLGFRGFREFRVWGGLGNLGFGV